MGAVIRLAAMPGKNRLPPLLVLLFVVAALSGCGSDEISGEIPETNAADLNAALDRVRFATESSPPNCEDAALGAEQFVQAVNALPADPAAELKPELQAAGDNLRTLVENQCAATEPTGTQPQETSSTTSSTTTSSSTTEPTNTTTTSTTTSTDETQPPGNGNGGGPPGGVPPGQDNTDGGTGGTGGGTGDETGD